MKLVQAGLMLVLIIGLNTLKSDCAALPDDCISCQQYDPSESDDENGCQCILNLDPTGSRICPCRVKREDASATEATTTAAVTGTAGTPSVSAGKTPEKLDLFEIFKKYSPLSWFDWI